MGVKQALLGAAFCACSAGGASAAVLYGNDFESGTAGTAWSGSAPVTLAPNGQRVLGFFTNEAPTLTLSGLGAHDRLTLSLDLYAVHTVDAYFDCFACPETWTMTIQGGPSFTTNFTAASASVTQVEQAYPDPIGARHPAGTGASAFNTLGYTALGVGILDARYPMSFTFDHTADTLSVSFFGTNWQTNEYLGFPDELWALDNVTVSTAAAVSEPDSLGLLGLGLLAFGAGWRRRRRAGAIEEAA